MSFFGLFGSKKKKHTEEQHAVAPAAAPAPQAAPPDVQQDIMAAISAAVYAVMYSSENTTARVEIKRPSLLWAQTGRLSLMEKRQACY